MPRIFVSYRRDDSDVVTGRLADRLKACYGRRNVFLDIDSIPLGVDFRKHVTEALSECDVVLAVIGPKWTSADSDGKRRIDSASDYVRVELETALEKGLPTIPLLIGDTPMPSADHLPPSLEPLAYRNGCPIDPGRDFHLHTDRLIDSLNAFGKAKGIDSHELPAANHNRRSIVAVIEVASGPRQGEKFDLVKDRVVIGRRPDCDICFDVGAISGYHAQFVKLDDGFALEDLGARNGSYVNGQMIRERRVLSDGDRIHTGALILVYRCSS